MIAKRIIPCLDIQNGRTVKGIRFEQLRDAGDPVELAVRYCEEGADELVFLDITATRENRKTFSDLVNRIALHINIPFTVGGGIKNKEDVKLLLDNGADKISINTAAVLNPPLISELAEQFGSQCIVVAIDTKREKGEWRVATHAGTRITDIPAIGWAQTAVRYGAGEILLTSMEHDGTQQGFALDITKEISQSVSVPVIASGGAGSAEDFLTVFRDGCADAALAAGLFHFGKLSIPELKSFLKQHQIPVRS
ncbi:MAG: imidazole glycerol phosphate synthase subunit HisF [Chitinophagaceae bacterium]|nr:imidazole glycerol phosphate synthase subunit HisF [Chitinophagaceae bacterium]